ncbi:MAG: Uma2 family endonuclease [Cyanobacteriota bacterium]|nr:Uma2 family endonuclease [Cyanobacteriota bacterium]
MSETLTILAHEYPDTSNMILEDDEPLDSFINEKQQRLLTTVFYSGAELPIQKPFVAAANVGLFATPAKAGIAPDAFLSLGIHAGEDWWQRKVRSYLFWEFGKPPDIVIEVISPTPGNELGSKLTDYADLRIPYYVVYDPLKKVGENTLRVFELRGRSYVPKSNYQFPDCNIGLTLWTGTFEDINGTWLRWCYPDGKVIPTGDELAAIKDVELSQKDTQLSQKDVELSQKDAELSQKDVEIRETLLLAIEVGLNLKFPEESEVLLSELEAINEVGLLKAIASNIASINSVEQLREIYNNPPI